MSSTLIKLMIEDGLDVIDTGDGELRGECWSPHHSDSRHSMRIDVVKGRYLCHTCGFGGDTLKYLMGKRGMETLEAMRWLKRAGYSGEQIKRMRQSRNHSGPPTWRAGIPDRNLRGWMLAGTYHYAEASMAVAEYRPPIAREIKEYRSSPEVQRVVFSKAFSQGSGWWRCDCLDRRLPEEDASAELYPLYRIDDALERLESTGHDRLMVLPDERTTELVRGLDHPDGPIPAICFFAGGWHWKPTMKNYDIEPLRGRKLLFHPHATGKSINRQCALLRLVCDRDRENRIYAWAKLPAYGDGDLGHAIGERGLDAFLKWGGSPIPSKYAMYRRRTAVKKKRLSSLEEALRGIE